MMRFDLKRPGRYITIEFPMSWFVIRSKSQQFNGAKNPQPMSRSTTPINTAHTNSALPKVASSSEKNVDLEYLNPTIDSCSGIRMDLEIPRFTDFQESLHKTGFCGSKNLGLQNPMGFLLVFVGRPENWKVEKWKLTRLPMSFKRTGDARFLPICWEICGFAMYGDAG